MSLPGGYDHPVTERGSTLSTGQRQLLAFARTIAAQPKILILDEATANIDQETEEMIQNSLKKMRQGRTTIAIAHRLSTIQDADCIYVLDKGKYRKEQKKGAYTMSNDLIMMGVVIVLFGLYFTLQVELNKVRNQFTHYLLKPGSISKEQREKYLKEPEMEAIRLIRLDYRIGLQNAKLVYEQLKN